MPTDANYSTPPNSDPTDPDLGRSIELIERFQGGEDSALNELFTRYRDRLCRIVAIRMGPHLRQLLDEEDIVQDVFVVAARRIGDFTPSGHGSILRWLAAIAENQLRDQAKYHHAEKRDARRRVRLRLEPSSQSGPGVADPTAQTLTPSQKSVRAEVEELVDACLRALEPTDYREVILRRDYYGDSWDHVQRALDRPSIDAAYELYRRAHRKLRDAVKAALEK